MDETLAAFDHYLRTRKRRLTPQRERLARLVLSQAEHLSADQITARARARHLDVGRATVYRTLDLLCDSGLVQPVDLDGDARLFEPMQAREHHDHLRCTDCGLILEFESPLIEALQEEVALQRGFTIQSHRHEIFGLCRDCTRPTGRRRKPRPQGSPRRGAPRLGA